MNKTYIQLFILAACFVSFTCQSQLINRTFLLGYAQTLIDTNTTSPKARLAFDQNSAVLLAESRKMSFRSAQATISNQNGDLIIATNGCWIANALGDTMLNGSGLNPGTFTNDWCDAYSGNPYVQADLLLPFPGDSNKYILFHQIGNYVVNGMASSIYYSIIDMTLDGGLGGVTQKNVVAVNDTFAPGFAACRHGNGRDWWIVSLKNNSNKIYKLLLTPTGISSITTQPLLVPNATINLTQPNFSPDGTKFAYNYFYGSLPIHQVRLFDFNRCNGFFNNQKILVVSDGYAGLSTSFSSNSKYLYTSSWNNIYQFNTDTTNVQASVQNVAVNDGYYSPQPPFQTDFWTMYLAANGKIYISSGNGVLDMHYMDYPDSAGVACSVQQHALHLPCYYARAHVYHPNFNLGAADNTLCDTLGLNPVNELSVIENSFRIMPNPNNGQFSISYLLPQNEDGKLEIFDMSGKIVYQMPLPTWSTFQAIDLSFLKGGIYQGVITSGEQQEVKKIVVLEK